MIQKSLFTFGSLAAVFMLVVSASSAATAADAEFKTIKLRDLSFKSPADWKQEKPRSNLRLAQFKIPAAEGDKEGAELAVFNFGGGGSVEANVKRWIGQFDPQGRTTKVAAGESEQGKYVFVNISGTYNKPVGPPVLRKTEPARGYRMAAAIVLLKGKGVYFLKMTGPDATVAKAAPKLKEAIGADPKKEKELKLQDQ